MGTMCLLLLLLPTDTWQSRIPLVASCLAPSGVAEPARVQNQIDFAASEAQDAVAMALQLDNVVTLVDCSTFGELCMSGEKLMEREELGAQEGMIAQESVSMLLVEQIECAQLVILNKTDTVDAQEIKLIKSYISALNDKARIIEASYGQVCATLTPSPSQAAATHFPPHSTGLWGSMARPCMCDLRGTGPH